jgi:hypothetical protein
MMTKPSSSYFLTAFMLMMALFDLLQIQAFQMMTQNNDLSSRRRRVLQASGSIFGLPFFGGDKKVNAATTPRKSSKGGLTNEVVKVVNGIKHRRLGGSDVVVSELGLGAQRWASADFNAPDKDLCYAFMDEAILKRGINLIDTAEQYPM